MARYVRFYIEPKYISNKLHGTDKGKNVIFTNAHIAEDGMVDITAAVLDEPIQDSVCVDVTIREKLE